MNEEITNHTPHGVVIQDPEKFMSLLYREQQFLLAAVYVAKGNRVSYENDRLKIAELLQVQWESIRANTLRLLKNHKIVRKTKDNFYVIDENLITFI